MAKFKTVADAKRQGDGRYNAGDSLYLVVRGGSALWEHQFREAGKLRTKSYGSATGAAPVTFTKARALSWADRLDRRNRRQIAGNARFHSLTIVSNGNGNGGASMLTPFSSGPRQVFFGHAGRRDPAMDARTTRNDQAHVSEARRDSRHSVRSVTITLDEMADLLRPIWKGPGSHTGNRVRGLIEKILRSAGVKNDDNPALWENLQTKLSNKIAKSVPRASLPFADVPAFMKELAVNETIQAKALRFMVLTSTRQDEVLEATWGEFDLVERTWTIPGDVGAVEGRMKMDDAHKIWLSDAAMEILKSLPSGSGHTLVFPSKLGTRMAQQTIRELAQELRPNIKVTPHGFRSSMTTWAEEQGDGNAYNEKVIMAAIAHYSGDANKKAYLRSKLYAPRKKLMTDWCAFATS